MAFLLTSITLLIVFLSCGLLTLETTRTLPASTNNGPADDDGVCKSVVEPKGYICEEHTVVTKDGYILSLQRIPSGHESEYSSSGRRETRPVLLQHGVLMDGVTWLINPPNQSLAFILADNGFDVWIANSRGTKYSYNHTALGPNDPAYWDWSWDELVAYDLPAMVQYVYDQCGQKKLGYVGHSQGTLIALAAFSQRKLLDMVRSAALLSPIAYISQMTSPLAEDVIDNFISEIMYWLGLHQFNPRGAAIINLLKDLCKKPGIDCTNLLTSFTGQNCCLSTSTVPTFLDHEPQSTATKNMIHLAQMARFGRIAMYDYVHEDDNMKHYGQSSPPVYNITNIPKDLPLYLSYGGRDALADVNDVQLLLDGLKNHDGNKLWIHFIEEYAHADFVMAVSAKKLVYDSLLSFFALQQED